MEKAEPLKRKTTSDLPGEPVPQEQGKPYDPVKSSEQMAYRRKIVMPLLF